MGQNQSASLGKWLLLIGLSFSGFTLAYSTTGILNALPAITKALNLTNNTAEWAVNAYMLACACFIVLGGRMGDRFSARWVFYIGIGFFFLATIVTATAQYNGWFLLGRALQGISAAMIMPNTLAIVKLKFPESKAQKVAIGIWSAFVSLGFSLGPLVAGLLVDSIGWRYVFWINLPLMGIAFLLCIFVKRGATVSKMLKIDYLGQLLLILSIFLIALGLTESIELGWHNCFVWTCLIIGAVLFVWFYFVEKRVVEPTIDFAVFRHKTFAWSVILVFITFFALITLFYVYNLYVQNPTTLNFNPLTAGLSILPATLCVFVLSFILPHVGAKVGFRYPTAICFFLMALGFLWFFFLPVGAGYGSIWGALILIGIGLGGTFPCVSGLALGTLEAKQAGLASSIVSVTIYITTTVSTAMNGTIYINVALRHLSEGLKSTALNLASELETILQNLIANKPLHQILTNIPASKHAKIASLIQSTATYSFNDTMLLTAIICFIGAGLTIRYIRD